MDVGREISRGKFQEISEQFLQESLELWLKKCLEDFFGALSDRIDAKIYKAIPGSTYILCRRYSVTTVVPGESF